MKDRETQKDDAHAAPPLKAKTGGEQERGHKHSDGHPPANPDLLRGEHLAHPANAEPLAGLLSQLQQTHGNAYVQRVVSEAGGEKAQEAKPSAESKRQGNAQALDAGTRSLMESAFGEGFGDVRVHTGEEAGAAAEQLDARAFTRGRDIYFNQGEYNPSTREGKELLAHELAHIVQQGGGAAAPQSNSTGREGDAHEQEADRAAASVLGGERAHVEKSPSAPAFQLQGRGGGNPMGPLLEELGDIRLTTGHTSIRLGSVGSLGIDMTSAGGVDRVRISIPEGVELRISPFTQHVNVESNPGGTHARTVVFNSRQNPNVRRILILSFEASRPRNTIYHGNFFFPGTPIPPPPVVPAPPPGRP